MIKQCPNCGYDLTKKKVKLTLVIDESVVIESKKFIANLSQYVEHQLIKEKTKLQQERDRARG